LHCRLIRRDGFNVRIEPHHTQRIR
jgi:hypothetical protein